MLGRVLKFGEPVRRPAALRMNTRRPEPGCWCCSRLICGTHGAFSSNEKACPALRIIEGLKQRCRCFPRLLCHVREKVGEKHHEPRFAVACFGACSLCRRRRSRTGPKSSSIPIGPNNAKALSSARLRADRRSHGNVWVFPSPPIVPQLMSRRSRCPRSRAVRGELMPRASSSGPWAVLSHERFRARNFDWPPQEHASRDAKDNVWIAAWTRRKDGR